MEDRHKLAIQKNYVQLITHCDVRNLIPALLQSQVFSVQMIEKYNIGTDTEVKRKLFLDVQKRGPEAFAKLVAALRQTNQNYLANLLDPTIVPTVVQPKKPGRIFMLSVDDEAGGDDTAHQIQNLAQDMPWSTCINLNSQPINIKIIPGTQFYDQEGSAVPVYSTHSKNRGAVLIINIIKYDDNTMSERSGADVDSRNLHELFLQLGFKVEMYTNLTGEQIKEAIRNFKSSPLLISVDMVFVIVMAHGNQDKGRTHVIGVDDVIVETDWIEQQFDNANSKVLQRKPKIIMYQTCRGDFPDFGTTNIQMDSAVKSIQPRVKTRTLNDILVAHSTLPGFASHRDILLGTWYISNFCETVMNHAHNMHIEDIFKVVDSKLAQKESADRSLQTSMYSNLGFKKCYLHPMIYLENGVIKRIDNNG